MTSRTANLDEPVAPVYDEPGRSEMDYQAMAHGPWRRGPADATFDMDEWDEDTAPSSDPRRWYRHVPERSEKFACCYRVEPQAAPAEAGRLPDQVLARRWR